MQDYHDVHPRQHGNSFAYAALALIIAGLVMGVGMAWYSLYHSNELRRSISALEEYQTATAKFKDKFEKLPGDIPYATRIWGASYGAVNDGYDARCATSIKPSEGKRTCNGNGDGWPYDSLATSPSQHYERFRFWQHLANADLIGGEYTGIGGPHNRKTHHVPGVNSPNTAFSDGMFVVTSVSESNGDVSLWPNPAHLRIELRSDYHARSALLTPQQQYEIDAKMDDGQPATGKVQSYSPMRQPDCTTSNTPSRSQYNLGREGVSCSIIYFLDY